MEKQKDKTLKDELPRSVAAQYATGDQWRNNSSLISSASVRSILLLSFIVPIFAWNVPLVALIFLKRSLVFQILLFSSISLHWSLRTAFLSPLVILWNSAFRWVSVQFSHSVMSDSLRPHGLQHARLPCPSPTSGVYSNSCPLSRWCHSTISSSVIPLSPCLQPFASIRVFSNEYIFPISFALHVSSFLSYV